MHTFPFTIDFVDECRSATVVEQQITTTSPVFTVGSTDKTTVATLSAYIDTVD